MGQPPRISTTERERTLDRLDQEAFDCVVVGGGITGAGVAREAAQRGLRVALLEANDFASGTSSRSSKLIHGGLRYLAMGDVGLVRETALERKAIHALAPHLSEPRWMLVPARSRTGSMKVRAGIAAYERLGAVAEADRHRNWSEEETAREEPLIRHATYPHVCAYREYLTDDSRLVLANLRAAVREGGVVLNHASVDAVIVEGSRASGVEARCQLSGRRIRVRARCVINAAGPWVDAIRNLEDASAPPLLHVSKGIHVVLPADRVPLRNMVVLGASDGRSIFVIRQGDIVYVGTTDTTYERGAEVWPEITSDDVEYLLEPLPRYLDLEPVKPEEVTAAWAGLRPLIAEPGKPPHEISRRDEILVGSSGVVTIAGGKLTGYRLMARRTVETAGEVASLTVGPAPEDARPLPGGDFEGDLDALAGALVRETGVSEKAAERLVRLYGTEAAAAATGGPTLVEGEEVSAAEVDWAVTHEGAATVEDVLYRRTRLALYAPALRHRAIEPIARRMAELLRWEPARRERETESCAVLLAEELAFASGEKG
jgi:glycerol-3-phosphate dehydrogenase